MSWLLFTVLLCPFAAKHNTSKFRSIRVITAYFSMSHPYLIRPLRLPSDLFPWGFPNQTLYAFSASHINYVSSLQFTSLRQNTLYLRRILCKVSWSDRASTEPRLVFWSHCWSFCRRHNQTVNTGSVSCTYVSSRHTSRACIQHVVAPSLIWHYRPKLLTGDFKYQICRWTTISLFFDVVVNVIHCIRTRKKRILTPSPE